MPSQPPVASVMGHRLLTAVLLLVAAGGVAPRASADDGAAAVVGTWSGPVTVVDGEVLDLGSTLTLVVASSGDGFEFVLRSGQAVLDAQLSPDGHPGVYEAPTHDRSSIFSLFKGSQVADPLTGAPLVWARTTPGGVIVYRLDLDSGAFRLDRMAATRQGDGVQVEISERRHQQPVGRVRATLVRQGG